MSAETVLEGRGIRMPSMLKSILRGLFTRAYQAGVEAQREVIVMELEATPEGRALLEKTEFARPRRLP